MRMRAEQRGDSGESSQAFLPWIRVSSLSMTNGGGGAHAPATDSLITVHIYRSVMLLPRATCSRDHSCPLAKGWMRVYLDPDYVGRLSLSSMLSASSRRRCSRALNLPRAHD